MKKAWTILLWLMLLVWGTAVACAEEGTAQNEASAFLFRNGVTWDSTPEMVINSEGDADYEHFDLDGWSIYHYSDVAVSDYNGNLAYCFAEDKLLFAFYYYSVEYENDLSMDDFWYLTDALEYKYGKPIEADKWRLSVLLSAADPGVHTISNLTNWQLDDGTYIAQLKLNFQTHIMYFNEAQMLEMRGVVYNTFGL